MLKKNKVPVLFIMFNRPEQAFESFQAIKKYRPDELYIAADGPRSERSEEALLCQKTRQLVLNEIDWECNVHKLFREENVGCGRGPSEGISWMFETEEHGIIIEDDCIVSDEFFSFCEEMLVTYKDETKVAQVNCFVPQHSEKTSDEYYFTGYPSISAWATWRRAWIKMDYEMSSWKKIRFRLFKRFSFQEACIHYLLWNMVYNKIKRGKKSNAWDYQWSIYVFMDNKLCIEPQANLVRNIGFGENSTNCSDINSPLATAQHGHLLFPLKHPSRIELDVKRERDRSNDYVQHYRELAVKKLKKMVTG